MPHVTHVFNMNAVVHLLVGGEVAGELRESGKEAARLVISDPHQSIKKHHIMGARYLL